MQYKVVWGTQENLSTKVNEAIAEGWVPVGSPFLNGYVWMDGSRIYGQSFGQAMTYTPPLPPPPVVTPPVDTKPGNGPKK